MDYIEAKELLGKRKSKKIDRNTYLQEDGDNFVVKLHKTNVVTFKPDEIVLTSGGWKTLTTRDKISHALAGTGVSLCVENGVWILVKSGKKYLFEDGVRMVKGKVKSKIFTEGRKKKANTLKKSILNYATGFVDAFFEDKVEMPSSGDCWMCSMVTEDGTTLGQALDDSHLKEHIKESYYVPSLLVNAIEEFPVSIMAKSVIWYTYHDKTKKIPNDELVKMQMKNSIKKYLIRHIK